jgi:hypothetical protein
MQAELSSYMDISKENVKQRISLLLSDNNTKRVSQESFAFHFADENSLSFQKYYVQSIANRDAFLSSNNFFRIFKQKYALQGIDNNFLDTLENQKNIILRHIDDNNLAILYFNFFANAKLQHGETTINKNLGSFFSKLVHTFCPDKFCALDNPIKNYFGLGKESFYVAFIIVSNAYQEWANENYILMPQIRNEFDNNPIANPYSLKMTNLKLLDLIFWYEANKVGAKK